MTDGGVYVGEVDGSAVEFKRFFVPDTLAVRLLRSAGLKVFLLSGRVSEATRVRARELGVDEVIQDDLAQKLPALKELLQRFKARPEDTAFLGDDLADLPVLLRVGMPVAVRNAVPEIKHAARYVTEAAGGFGAVREFAEALLKARGQWDKVLHDYLSERGIESTRASRALHF